MVIRVYTDGSSDTGCDPKPWRGGWAFVIPLPDGKVFKKWGSALGDEVTNNRMELQAPLEALMYIKSNKNLTKDDNILIISDSQYVVNSMSTWAHKWKEHNWCKKKDPIKNPDIVLPLYDLSQEMNVIWRWVRGHNGDTYNEMADHFAEEARKGRC